MKKLLFILEHLNTGGVERSLVDILHQLDYSKYKVDLLLYQEKGDYESEIPPQVNVLYYPTNDAFGRKTTVFFNALKRKDWFSLRFRVCYDLSKLFGYKVMRHTRKLFKETDIEYDCAVSCRPGVINNSLLVYVFRSKKKVVWWHHGELGMNELERKRIDSLVVHVDGMIAVSEYSKRIVTDNFSMKDENTIVIPNMISADRLILQSKKDEAVKHDDRLMFCSVGRFSNEKNMLLCPEIGKKLKQKGIEFVWYLIGDGNQLDEAKKRVNDLGLEDCFIFTERIANPYPYVAAADVFIHPSWLESQGIAILEAMALRTPVVVVESGGPKEYIKSGVNGYLVRNDVDEICKAVQKVINSEDNNQALIENAYQTAQEFSPEKIVPLLDQLFSS